MSRLFLRVETISGPRTIISHELSPRDAAEIANALATAGFDTVVHDDIVPVSLAALVKRRKRIAAAEVKRISTFPANVTKMVKRVKS